MQDVNAGNAEGVAMHLSMVDDPEAPQPSGGTGDRIAAYSVTPNEDWGPYEGFVTKSGHPDKSRKIGRSDAFESTVVYSFPKEGKFTHKKIAEVPLSDVRAKLKEQAGSDSFDWTGVVAGAKAIRESFKGKAVTKFYSADQPRDDHGRWTDEGGSDIENQLLTEHKMAQAKFEKETGKLGLRHDALLTGDRLPLTDLTGHLDAVAAMQRDNMKEHRISPDQKYGGTADYLQHEGKEFDVPDKPPQIKLGTPKQCYSNAADIAAGFLKPSGYDYAEGLYASSRLPFPIEHAWLVDKATGKAVDPTLGWQPKARYFGVQYPREFLRKKLMENRYYGLHSDGHMMNKVVFGLDKDMKYAK